jgi:hypothetical protein
MDWGVVVVVRGILGQVRGHVINVGEREVDDDEEYRGAESSGK